MILPCAKGPSKRHIEKVLSDMSAMTLFVSHIHTTEIRQKGIFYLPSNCRQSYGSPGKRLPANA